MFGSVWPAPDEMAMRGAQGRGRHGAVRAVHDRGRRSTTAPAEIPWAKTPIYLVEPADMADFVCTHQHWLNIDEVYKNVPDKKPICG